VSAEGGPGPEPASPPGAAARHPRAYTIPGWILPLGLVTLLEPPVLIIAHFVNPDLADGHLIAYAFVGGLFISLPSLAILGLAVIWHQRMTTGGDEIPGVPPTLTGPTASRISAISLLASTLAFALLLAVLLGPWSLLALPPLALSLGSARLMLEAGAARTG
jgi:hypothetical protein